MPFAGGGSLEFSELKPALKKLQTRSERADADAAAIREKAAAMRVKAEEVRAIGSITESSERTEFRLKELEDNQSIEARLGAMIMKRNMKIGEVVSKWDKDGDNTVSRAEFRQNVKELGVDDKSSTAKNDINALFDSLDTDGGGALDLEEVKILFKKLLDSAVAAAQELKELTKAKDKVRRSAARKHSELAAQRVEEAAEAAAATEAAQRAAEEKKAAAAAAKEEARLAKEAKKLAAEEEKRRMEEAGKERERQRKEGK